MLQDSFSTRGIGIILFCSFATSPLFAQYNDLQAVSARLDLITKTADKMCGAVEAHGNGIEAKGEISAELDGLLKKLADLKGSVDIDVGQYVGVLRADAAKAIFHAENCRAHIFDSLKEVLLQNSLGSSPQAAGSHLAVGPNDSTPLAIGPAAEKDAEGWQKHLLGDDAAALPLLQYAAAEGSAAAQFHLAYFYVQGRGGVQRNEAEAVRLYKLSAAQGFASAQTNLGYIYSIGYGGTTKNDAEAARLYKLAADQGFASAQMVLGDFYVQGRGGLKKNDVEADRLYKLAADQGNMDAQCRLGAFYQTGRGGESKNYVEAARLYKLAADQGNAQAQFRLGLFYQNGLGGLRKNSSEANRLFKLAADQGLVDTQKKLFGSNSRTRSDKPIGPGSAAPERR